MGDKEEKKSKNAIKIGDVHFDEEEEEEYEKQGKISKKIFPPCCLYNNSLESPIPFLHPTHSYQSPLFNSF